MKRWSEPTNSSVDHISFILVAKGELEVKRRCAEAIAETSVHFPSWVGLFRT